MVIYEAALVVQRHFHALGAVALQKTEVTTTTKAPFLKPMFVEPTGGGVCHPWDPPDNHDLREAQLAHQPFVNKVELGVL